MSRHILLGSPWSLIFCHIWPCSAMFPYVLLGSDLFHNILQYYPRFWHLPPCFVNFCHALSSSAMFQHVLYCSAMFCHVPLCSAIFHSVLLCSIMFCCISPFSTMFYHKWKMSTVLRLQGFWRESSTWKRVNFNNLQLQQNSANSVQFWVILCLVTFPRVIDLEYFPPRWNCFSS